MTVHRNGDSFKKLNFELLVLSDRQSKGLSNGTRIYIVLTIVAELHAYTSRASFNVCEKPFRENTL